MSYSKAQIANLCTLVTSGGTPLTSVPAYYDPKEVPWLKTGEVNYCRIYDTESYISKEGLARSSAKMIPANSVVVAMYGQGDTAGRVAINKIPLSTNQACCNLVINHVIADYEYVYYALCTLYDRLVALKNGGAQPNLNAKKIKAIEIPFPDLETQRTIASVLGAYDNLIENNQKQIKLLEEAARRLYKEWFVDLRFPGYEDTPIVDGVPEGWERLPVGELIEKIPRTTQIMASEYGKEGPIPIIDQSRGFIAGYTDNHASLVNVGKPVIVFGDHTRILKYIQFPFAKGADGTQLIVSNTDRMPQSLFYCSLVGVDLSNYHYARHFKYLKAEELLVPTQVIAEAFDHFVSPMFSKIQRLRDINKAATNARDRLLPKLMSGEIEV